MNCLSIDDRVWFVGGEEVQHDRLGVEAGRVDLVGAVARDDVVACRRLVPEVGRLGHLADHDLLVPQDAARRVLVLVRKPDGVAELVRRGAAVLEAEVHRRFVERDVARVGADVAPGAVIGVEGDADVGIRRIAEDELEVGHRLPPAGLRLGVGAFGRAAADEAHLQRAAVHPRLADRCYATHAAAAHGRRLLRPAQVARQDAVEADMRAGGGRGAGGHGGLLGRD
jgi:hypothetical protein